MSIQIQLMCWKQQDCLPLKLIWEVHTFAILKSIANRPIYEIFGEAV